MKTPYRFGSSLVALTLAATACGGSEAVERPTITATPTTVSPTTEPPVTDAATTTVVNEAGDDESDADEAEASDDAATQVDGDESADADASEQDATEQDASQDDESNDALLEIAIVQIVGLGYTDEEAACVAGNLDFNDPRVLSIDPEVIVPAFEDCDADPEAFLELAPD